MPKAASRTCNVPIAAWIRLPPSCRFVLLLALWCVIPSLGAQAQLCVTSHTTNLYCLIPATFHTVAAPFNALFTPFGTELSELPIAKPAGTVLAFEHGVLTPATESLGAVFSERAETLGTHRLFLGFAYQNFSFSRIDGLDLRNLPIILYDPAAQVNTVTQSRFDVRVGQYTGLLAYGLTRRVDLSVSVPFERISLVATVNGTEFGPTGSTAPVHERVPGSASGIADTVVGAKATLLDREQIRLAAGLEARIPSGDELNFLGSGTVGVRPYLAASRRGRVSPHANFGYQWNGHSILNATATGQPQQLPTDLFYTAGANFQASKRWELVADLVGRHFFGAPRLTPPTLITIRSVGMPTVGSTTAPLTTNDLSVGFKVTQRHFTATGNVATYLNQAGLRARIVPLGGLSYSF